MIAAQTAGKVVTMRKKTDDKSRVVYIGDDWFLYSGVPGTYDDSEMLAPGYLLAPPGEHYEVRPQTGEPIRANALLHPSCLWSSGIGSGILLLYLDPLAEEGRAINRCCGQKCKPCNMLAGFTSEIYSELATGSFGAQRARTFVEEWRQQIRADLPIEPAISKQFLLAAKHLAENVEGRFDLTKLCSAIELNPDYFRKQFKEFTGMSPSRYQGWHRLLGLLKLAAEMYVRNELKPSYTIPTDVVDVGYYDISHASRTLERYFGGRPGTLPTFIDCRRDRVAL